MERLVTENHAEECPATIDIIGPENERMTVNCENGKRCCGHHEVTIVWTVEGTPLHCQQ